MTDKPLVLAALGGPGRRTAPPDPGLFDRHGYTAPGDTVGDLFPGFRMTALEEHIRGLWPR